ncbi:MAG: hypothetical protein M0P91_05210 [Sulfuricurvum sp.]|jgi:hypothetical protein|uniref:hypothetical protein n=1 Tax=Sulfuricurvum sp. TaxID=2025608 RepID=UPI0025D78231|nr:hypothetical protein [Sulfuricurvum sp.]MCK9372574.1 hypothetical protein [Sulfuricurvum sp.]
MNIVEPLPLTLTYTTAPVDDANIFDPAVIYNPGSRSVYVDSVYEKIANTAMYPTFYPDIYYPKGSTVSVAATNYIASVDIVFLSPQTDTQHWQVISDKGEWGNITDYAVDDIVWTYDSGTNTTFYICLMAHSKTQFDLNNTSVWKQVQMSYGDTVFYRTGDVVYKAPLLIGSGWYKCIQNISNQDPATDTRWVAQTTATPNLSKDWVLVGKSNPNRCIDNRLYTVTHGVDVKMVFTTIGFTSTIALIGLSAGSVRIIVKAAGATIFDETKNTIIHPSLNWFEWLFDPLNYLNSLVVDLPICKDPEITFFFNGSIEIGHIVAGKMRIIGDTLWKVSGEMNDYSIKAQDQFGQTDLIEGNYSMPKTFAVQIDSKKMDLIENYITSRRAKLSLFVGSKVDAFATTVFGYPRSFSTVLEGPVKSVVNLEIEEVV